MPPSTPSTSLKTDSSTSPSEWPKAIMGEAELEEVMTRPSPKLIQMMRRLEGDLIILGIAGKMGITLGRLAVRACEAAGVKKRVIGVSRFSDASSRGALEQMGMETMACDLLDPEAVAGLPRIPNVIFMAGRKFGTTGAEALTWAANTLVPGNAAHHYMKSRIVAFSTACVYPLAEVLKGGCTETDPVGPIGSYAQSCLGREMVFDYYSQVHKTPTLLFRLSYAIDLRYGVLREIADKVWSGAPLDVTTGYANVIWQGDANSQALLSLEHCIAPAKVLNVTGRQMISIREVALRFGKLMGKTPQIVGKEAPTALVINSRLASEILEESRVTLDQMIEWTNHWVVQNGRSLNKPTHFEERSGQF